jgi:hypothetical protein
MARIHSTIDRAYRDAAAAGIADPAVIVLDLRDDDARAIGCALRPEGVIAGAILEAGRRGKVPMMVVGLSRGEFVELLAAFTRIPAPGPEVGLPPGGYLLAVLVPDQAALVEMPLPD